MAEKTKQVIKQMIDKGVEVGGGSVKWLKLSVKKEGGGTESTGVHRVIFQKEELRTDIRVYTSGANYVSVQGIRYWFEKDGESVCYDVPLYAKECYKDQNTHKKSNYLLSRFADCEEGDELDLEYIKRGQKDSFISVTKVGEDTIIDGEYHEGDFGEIQTDGITEENF